MADYIMTEPGVLDFANGLFTARDDKYSCYILIDKTTPEGQAEAKRIGQAIMDAIRTGVTDGGKDRDGKPRPAPLAGLDPDDPEQVRRLTLPLKDGDTDTFTQGEHQGGLRKDQYPEFAGHWFMKLSAGNHRMVDEQLVRDTNNRPLTRSEVYSGNKVRAAIWFNAYSINGRKGIVPRLTALLVTDPGTPLVERSNGDPFAGFNLPKQDAADPFAAMGV